MKNNFEILIIDNEADLRELLRWELESLGFNICEAKNGKEALEKLQIHPPDLMLVDIEMPVMSGMDFLQKALQKFGVVPASMIMTGNCLNPPEIESRLNVLGFIEKPFFPKDVGILVKLHIDQKQAG